MRSRLADAPSRIEFEFVPETMEFRTEIVRDTTRTKLLEALPNCKPGSSVKELIKITGFTKTTVALNLEKLLKERKVTQDGERNRHTPARYFKNSQETTIPPTGVSTEVSLEQPIATQEVLRLEPENTPQPTSPEPLANNPAPSVLPVLSVPQPAPTAPSAEAVPPLPPAPDAPAGEGRGEGSKSVSSSTFPSNLGKDPDVKFTEGIDATDFNILPTP